MLGDRVMLKMWDTREAVLGSWEATLHMLLVQNPFWVLLLHSAPWGGAGRTSESLCENVRCCKNHVLQVILGGARCIGCGRKRQPVEWEVQDSWMEEAAGVPRMTAMRVRACSSIALLIKLAACYLEAVMDFLTDSLEVSGWRTLPEALPTLLNRGWAQMLL